MKRATCALVLLAASTGGCSFFMVDRYHAPRPPTAQVRCTARQTWTLVDATVAVVAYGLSFYVSRYGGTDFPAYSGDVVGGLGVGFGVSAGYGFWNVRHCREEIAAHVAIQAAPVEPPAPEPVTEAEVPPVVTAEPDPVIAEEEAPVAEKPKPEPKKQKKKKPKKKRK